MNRCTQLDEILQVHVRWQPRKTQIILRSKLKVTWVLGCFSVCIMLRLPADGT